MTERIEQTADNSVLVLYLPVGTPAKLNEMRDYVVESLRKGVLVLAHGTAMDLKQLPKLGSVEVIAPDMQTGAEKPKAPTKKVPEQGTDGLREHDVKFMGAGGSEKKRIHERMCAYRAEKGIGSWDTLVAAIGKSHISVDVMRQLYIGEVSASMEDWRAIDKGLTRLGFKLDDKGASDG